MTVEEKIKKPFMRRLAIWSILTAALFVICYFYHSYSGTDFSPVVSVALILSVSFVVFNSLGLLAYFTDKSFSGKIVHIKVDVRLYKESALDRKIEKRTFVGMSVECDNGRSLFHEEMMPPHLTTKIPYREGDRVYHIKGAKHVCRFPRNDTETIYEPVSVICPICGAIHSLGTKACSFCENDLPWDPLVK